MANPPENKPVLHTRKHIARLEREHLQTRIILYTFVALLVVVVGLIAYGYVDAKYLQPRRPVAKIGNVGIPLSEWQARVRMERTRLVNQLTLYQQYAQYFGMDLSSQEQQLLSQLDAPQTLGQTVVSQMVDEELIRQESAKRGISVSPQEVQDAIQASYQYFPNGSPTPTITPTAVIRPTLSADTLALVTLTPTPGGPTATLVSPPTVSPTESLAVTGTPGTVEPPTATATSTSTPTPAATFTPAPTFTPLPTSTPFTQQGFENLYNTGRDKLIALGLTEEQVRQLYATNVLRQKLFDVVTADVPRTEEQVWARHILVADEASAKAVRQRLANGEDFSKVAAEVSTDTGTKNKGGDLGWFGKGAMVPEFETAAFALKVGEISQPVKSQFGYHIIQALAHADIPLDASGYDQARQTAFSDFLTKLRTDYKVVIYNNWQDQVPTDPAAPAIPQ